MRRAFIAAIIMCSACAKEHVEVHANTSETPIQFTRRVVIEMSSQVDKIIKSKSFSERDMGDYIDTSGSFIPLKFVDGEWMQNGLAAYQAFKDYCGAVNGKIIGSMPNSFCLNRENNVLFIVSLTLGQKSTKFQAFNYYVAQPKGRAPSPTIESWAKPKG